MKNFFVIVITVFICHSSKAQDTMFHKITRDYESFAIKKGYHLFMFAKREGKLDSVFKYDYGAYLGVHIVDVLIESNLHICLYESSDNVAYSIYQYTNEKKWSPLMGGILRFYNTTSKNKIYVSIIDKDKIQVGENEEKIIYKINYVKKTMEGNDE